jgi:biotin carboxylase
VPRFALITEPADTAEVAREVGFPAIVKPVNGSGSHLVLKVGTPAELAEAYRTLAERLPAEETGRIYSSPLAGPEGEGDDVDPRRQFLVEGLLSGREFCVDLVIRDGEIEQLPLVDKPIIDGRFFELAFATPPFGLTAEREARIRAAVSAAVRAIGLDNTVAHVEVIDDERLGPTIVEINAGRPGGMNTYTLCRLHAGIDTAAELVAVCRGVPAPREAPMLPIPLASLSMYAEEAGRLRAVHGIERLEAHPDVLQVVQVRKAGDLVSRDRETAVLLVVAGGFLDADDLRETYRELKGMIRLEFDGPESPAGDEETGHAGASAPAARQPERIEA